MASSPPLLWPVIALLVAGSPILVSTATRRTTAPIQQTSRTRQAVDVSKLGPQVGERVPDFSLQDQNGRSWTRQSIMGSNGAMLVFFRSADW
jgi:hypothetical protein